MISGYVSLLYSISEKPLEYWSKQHSQSGRIRKILDSDLLENVIELQDFEQHGYGTSITCPFDSSQFLNIKLPILVVVIKNLNLQCRIQLQITDNQNCLHNFQFTNLESEKQNSKAVICRVKVKLETGWNKLELNLASLTQTAFKQEYATTQRIQICGNCRLRRIYFIDKHYDDQEVCPSLYHKFLDSYMLKWGIHTVERSTQTNAKKTKSKSKSNNLKLMKQFSIEDLSAGEIARQNCSKIVSTVSKLTDENFLRNLQIKTDILINEFFNRQDTKLLQVSELKDNTALKPYAFPMLHSKKPFGYNRISEDALKRIGVLRTFTETYICNEEKRKENNMIQENWKHRYFFPQEKSLINKDLSKKILSKKILERKPKSLLILSELKSEKKQNSGEVKKIDEQSKRDESV